MRYKNIIRERYKLIIKYIGMLTMAIGGFLLLPLLVLPFYPEEVIYIEAFLTPAAIFFGIGFLLWKLTSVKDDVTLSLKEGGIIVLISWIVAIIASAIPFMITGELNFTQAIFEATSGWTTTGLSVVDVTKASHVFLMWRSIMQFFGGVGLIVVMLSSVLHPYGFGLYNAEGRSDQLLPHVKKSTKAIMYIYLGYIIGGTILYVIAGMGVFDAINHAIPALSTGGFSTKADSIGHWNSLPIEMVTWLLMIFGTINFATHFALLKGKFKVFFKNGEIRLLLFIIAIFTPIVSYFSLSGLYTSLPATVRRGFFEVVSAISTTGFSLDTFSNWNQFGVLAMVLLMWIGGGTGSTAGGIKLYRIYLMIKSVWWELKGYFLPPNSVVENYIWRGEQKLYIKAEYIRETANYIFLYMATYFIGVLIYLAYGYGLTESMFEFASSVGTVGLSIGITSPDAPVGILWTQTVGMFLGRLEFLVIFFAIAKIVKDAKYLATE
ncbi:trk system potassium uptake protein TrkH [Orenia metallireducens]|uniref:Trk system potassium uptake protein TrkH n=1 Tax=Orenia metallireducens TaxID=1413210 RepID=A0A285GU56_9FIRM|nr:TrkH family potassium uptake protein [Orenia metallireducens]PRX25278.1 trk system potassium uptake protein TrkH [Orenia metallireducens]SNY27092.1 trk system potassium uptake protein TrkH [Orenia metallireducens]